MRTKNIFVFLTLILAIGFWGCTKEQKAEAPAQQEITKDLVPAKAEVKSQNFLVELDNLKIDMTVDTASKEILATPSLKGNFKITNESKDNMDIQSVSLEYLDNTGKPIAFSSGEKVSKPSLYLKTLKPGETAEGSLDATIPRAVAKNNNLGNIEINLVYVPSPIRTDTLTLPEKVG